MEKTIINKNIKEFVARLREDFSIRKMCDVAPEQLLEFNKAVYKNEFNASRFRDSNDIRRLWEWKYSNNPSSKGIKNFGWLASYKGGLIGQFHIIPSTVKIGDKFYKAAWGSDLAVLKQYRNIGISAFLIQHARQEVAKDFDLFLLGGMNKNSYNVFIKSGFVNLGKIPRYVKILDVKTLFMAFGVPFFLSLLAQKITHLAGMIFSLGNKEYRDLSVEIVGLFDADLNAFWNSVEQDYTCIARRDVNFLKWRYMDQPLWPYTALKVVQGTRIKGFAVVREGVIRTGRLKNKRIGVISDIIIDHRDMRAANKLLQSSIDFFKNKNVFCIKCEILNKHIQKALSRAWFVRIKSMYSFMLNVYENNISKGHAKLAVKRENWFVSWGDSDLDYD